MIVSHKDPGNSFMQKNITHKLYCCLLLCIIPSITNAEAIVLKSGKVLYGKVVEKTDQSVKIDVFESGGVVDVLPEEIDTIKPDEENNYPTHFKDVFSSNPEVSRLIKVMFTQLPGYTKELVYTPEDARWPFLYYYRNKDSQHLIDYLNAILNKADVLDDGPQAAYYARFLAVALKDNPSLVKQVRSLQASVTPSQQNWLDAIIVSTQITEVLQANQEAHVDLLWADYRATGDVEFIRKIIAGLSVEEKAETAALLNRIETSLIFNTLSDIDIKDILIKERDSADALPKERLDAIVFIIDSLIDISATYQHRGYNYARLDNSTAAFASYEIALRICPDYGIVLNNLANLYKRVEANKEKSLNFAKAALYNSPGNAGFAYNLGIYYFTNNQLDEAIDYYKKAIDNQPNKPEYNHAIARAYQDKGDSSNAVKYFQNYITLAPHGEHEQLVRDYLNAHAPAAVLVNATDDPNVMLQQGLYDELEKYLEDVLQKNEKDENGYNKLAMIIAELIKPKAMGVMLGERLPLMEKWIQAKPEAHFANVVLGAFYIDYAWEARGKGFANTVVKEGYDLFKERLIKSKEYLTKAYDLNISDPSAPTFMVVLARGLGFEFDEMEMWFQRAIKANVNWYKAYSAKLTYLMPKWHGSMEQMFAFARDTADHAEAQGIMPVILAEAHWEMLWQDDSRLYFKKDPVAWKETKQAYEKILHDFQQANYHRNKFAWAASFAGDSETGRQLFNTIGDAWDPTVWKNKAHFEEKRRSMLP